MDLTINVSRAGGKVATASVLNPGNNNRALFGTVFNIDGQLNWESGNVDVLETEVASGININATGEFNINVTSGIWGVGLGTDTKYFQIQNAGVVTVSVGVGTATLRGDYTTTNLTRLEAGAGVLDLGGKAEQTAGTFELGTNSTVKVSASEQVLGIRDGQITGDGTINGNLNLGYNGGPTTAATIRPGIGEDIGIIDITQSMQIFSSSAQTWIRVRDDGSYSQIVAGGWAKLGGVLWIENSSNWHPAPGTHVDFLTAGLGFVGTDFAYKGVAYWGSWVDPGDPNKAVKWTLPVPTGNTYSLIAEQVAGSGPPPPPPPSGS